MSLALRRSQGLRYIRGSPWRSAGSHGAKVFRAGLATHAVDLGFVRKLLAFVERAHAGALDGADMHEHVVAAIVRLNEAEALGRVEPLNCSGRHFSFLQDAQMREGPARRRAGLNPISAMFLGSRAGSARSTSKSIVRMGGV